MSKHHEIENARSGGLPVAFPVGPTLGQAKVLWIEARRGGVAVGTKDGAHFVACRSIGRVNGAPLPKSARHIRAFVRAIARHHCR